MRPTTADQYRWALDRYVVPTLGALPLADVTAKDVQAMIDGLRARGLGASSIFTVRVVLGVALNDAVRLGLGLIPANPVDRTRAPKQERRKVEAFTLEELTRLLARASSTRIQSLLRFAAFSGLRRGEILALRWEDVDQEQGRVTVRRGRVKTSHGAAPKTMDGTLERGKNRPKLRGP